MDMGRKVERREEREGREGKESGGNDRRGENREREREGEGSGRESGERLEIEE